MSFTGDDATAYAISAAGLSSSSSPTAWASWFKKNYATTPSLAAMQTIFAVALGKGAAAARWRGGGRAMRTEFLSKASPAAPAGAVLVQAIRFSGREATTVLLGDWAFLDRQGSGCLGAFDEVYDQASTAFPVDKGIGLVVRQGDWILRHVNCSVEVMDDATFRATFDMGGTP